MAFNEFSEQYPDFQIVEKGFYYPYNHEHEDYGWGCAWRAIQGLLSSHQIEIVFKDLVSQYAKKNKLMEIIKQKIKDLSEEALGDIKWAPEEN